MDKINKGAIPKVRQPFLRSTKIQHTPPKDESEYYQCEACLVRTDEEIVQCDACQLWYHFSCANVTSDIKDYEWMCMKCRVPEPRVEVDQQQENPSGYQESSVPPTVDEVINQQVIETINKSTRSLKSKSGTSTSSRRRNLALQRLEEEKELEEAREARRKRREKEFLDKKYSILEDDITDEGDLSFDDEELNLNKFDSIKRWTEKIQVNVSHDSAKETLENQTSKKDQDSIPYLSSTNVDHQESGRKEVSERPFDGNGHQEIIPRPTIVDIGDEGFNLKSGQGLPKQIRLEPGLAQFLAYKDTGKLFSSYDENQPGKNQQLTRNVPTLSAPVVSINPYMQNLLSSNLQTVTSTISAVISKDQPVMSVKEPINSNIMPRIMVSQAVASNLNANNPGRSNIETSMTIYNRTSSIITTATSNCKFTSSENHSTKPYNPWTQKLTTTSEPLKIPRNNVPDQPFEAINEAYEIQQSLIRNTLFSQAQPFQGISQAKSTQQFQARNQAQPFPGISEAKSASVNTQKFQAFSQTQPFQAFNQAPQFQTFSQDESFQAPSLVKSIPSSRTQPLFSTNQAFSQIGSFQTASQAQPFVSANQDFSQARTFQVTSQSLPFLVTSQEYSQHQQFQGNGQMFSQPQTFMTNQSAPINNAAFMGNSQSMYNPYQWNQPIIVSTQQAPVMSTGIPNQSFINNQQIPSNNQFVNENTSTSIPSYSLGHPLNATNLYNGTNQHRNIVSFDDADGSGEQGGAVTIKNLMSRQVINKKLPIFSGNPEEWENWFTRYNNTTEKCNLDNSENIERLSECLRGRAREIVKSKLSQSEAVPWIISTLKKVFGRPEVVLKSVMKTIRAIPPIKNDNLKSMMEFAFEVQSVSATIESSGLLEQYRNPMLLEELVDKLPPHVKLDWARHKKRNPDVTIKTLTEWLDELADDISTVLEPTMEKTDKRNDKDSVRVNLHFENKPGSTTESKGSRNSFPCIICGKGCQKIENCIMFTSCSIEQKWKAIKEHKICRICLKKHKFPCKSNNVCGKNNCSFKHHQLLHDEERYSPKGNQRNGTKTSSVSNNVHYEGSKQTLLKYVPVVLHHNNKSVKTLAFLDDGSTASMMEQKLADDLGLSGSSELLCLIWTKNIHRKEQAQRVSLQISGGNGSQHLYPLNGILTVESLQLAAQTFKKEDLVESYPYLKHIDINDYVNAVPGILIGSDIPKLGSQLKVIEGKGFNSPMASKTRLGWIIHGPRDGKSNSHNIYHHEVKICPHHNQLDKDVHQQVKEYFTIENFGVRASAKSDLESKDDQRALDLLRKLTRKTNERYETGLLWKKDNISLPDSYPMAMKRLISLEKQGDKVVKAIGEKIADYVSKGYARKLTAEELKSPRTDVWYLPLFGVVHPKKPEKLRMVFDGAAKVKSTSLNSMLLKGPDQLASLVDILRRLREKKIAVSGDVKEMYHQVRIQEADQHYQRFLFRNGEANRKPDVYVMQVMTFGATCSPCAAQYVKNTNASEFKKTHPRAVDTIVNNHYVDDMMDGEDNVKAAIKLVQDVKMIHARAGFEIRNFLSNSTEVLKALGGESNNCETSKDIMFNAELKTERILGMWWNMKTDVFTFSLKYTLINKEILNGSKTPTKRELLRTLMSIFDPLGLLSNYLIHLKILLQDIWRAEIKWDEQVSASNLVTKWKQWLKYLPDVENVQVPRFYSPKLSNGKPKTVQIHTFVDASEDAFSAVIYLRIEDDDGIDCALMGSKARVAPLKYLSIPRKELQAAILGTRLMTSVINAQNVKIDRRIVWSDSETVLSWLKSDHRKYSQFVAHRVGEILESTDVNEWRWIPTKENVADEATKWSKFPNFEASNRWFSGPEFIRKNEERWPEKKKIKNNVEEEMKAHYVHSSFVIPQLVKSERFSKWNRLVRAVAYSIRFRRLFMNQIRKGEPLTQQEITKAENLIFRQSQFEGYPSEMVILERNKTLPLKKQKFIEKPSPLYDGSPFLDAEGVLRMKSRIDGARGLSLDAKRPIILPRDNHITKLLVHHYHAKYFHQNHQTVVNELRQRFYIPRIRVVVKKVRNNCQMCKVKLAKTMEPQMADLPQSRLATFARPFSYVGIDYFGPMKVKVGRRTEKRWGVLFTCLTIRAIHIELASSIDTNTCILCIGNFIADRGTPIEFHSDCGTNLVGSDNELKRELEKLDPEKLKTEFTSRYTNWVFNPPAAPHMGGSWERLIRSVKSGIYNALPERIPKEETLRNMLKEIQNVVNSRPLTFIPLEVDEDEALTPNHFLLGSSNGNKPPCKLNLDGPYLRRSWKEAQRLTELFWQRFVKEYLPTITRRTKWFKPTKPLEPDDLVLVVDEKNSRNSYPKAKVVETQMGSNGQVRRAKIQLISEARVDQDGMICKVRKTEMWRPAHKLALLDVLSKPEHGLANPEEDSETGGRMLETNVNTGPRRSLRIARKAERAGNTNERKEIKQRQYI